MSVVLLITVEATEGQRDALRSALEGILPDTLAFEGNESVELLLPREQTNTLILVEHWASMDAYDAYKAWRAESGTSVLGSDLVAGPPVTVVCDQ